MQAGARERQCLCIFLVAQAKDSCHMPQQRSGSQSLRLSSLLFFVWRWGLNATCVMMLSHSWNRSDAPVYVLVCICVACAGLPSSSLFYRFVTPPLHTHTHTHTSCSLPVPLNPPCSYDPTCVIPRTPLYPPAESPSTKYDRCARSRSLVVFSLPLLFGSFRTPRTMQTPRTPTINFDPTGGSSGPGGGTSFFGRSDPNAMMLQMGLSYGQNILQKHVQQGEAGLAYYMPFIRAIHNYFAVDNTYVKRKLIMLTIPFFTKYVRKSPAGGESDFGGSSGGAGEATGDQVFGGPASSPASVYPSVSPSMLVGPDGGGSTFAGPSLPLNDAFASDLYIPLMSVITYVVLAAYILGANSPTSSVTAASLISTAWVIGIWFFLEVVALKGIAYALLVVPNPPLLELLALCGYKYVLLCLGILASQCLPPSLLYSGLFMLYTILAHSFFTVRVLGLQYMRDDGRVSPRSHVFTYMAAIAQAPACVWLFVRLL
ncbi:hypothetical protein, conserved [Leishmania tarentolae]|uniref:Protein transport protein yif1 n=1 Tax=Leishmania tarentolae TaxID=5689 RepID=A0A640KEM9_LEITA|nr:hypothetical protein, conserved [Leishmania tarentolae]